MSFASFPSGTAHSINIIHMCQSMTRLGNRVILLGNILASPEKIYDHYGIQDPFCIENIHLKNIRFAGRLLAMKYISRLVKRLGADILFTRDIFNGWLASYLGKPFLFELHELPQGGLRQALLKRIVSSQNLQRLIFISERLESLFFKKYTNTKLDFCVAHDGVSRESLERNQSQEEDRKDLDLPLGKTIAGYTGSLFPGRGSEIIFQLARRFSDIVFLVVGGEGRYLDVMKQKIQDAQITNILALGHVPHKTVLGYLNSCDFLLMPYQKQVLHRQAKHNTVEYMSPLKMFEYLAAGKPIISSRIPVLEEVLTDERNALLVDPDDLSGWEKALKRLLSDQRFAQVLSEQARKDSERYTWDKRAATIFWKKE